MKKQAGFSLVELVIVIIVVGLLAVAALPRFLNVTDEAKKAQIEGVAGGFATAVLSARAQWEAYGRPQNNNLNAVNYDGTEFYLSTITNSNNFLTREGYPLSAARRNVASMRVNDCEWLMTELLQNPLQVTSKEADLANGDYQYFVEKTDGEGVDTECRYYQLASSNSKGQTIEPTSGHFFSYKPALGQVAVTLK
ncbi:prepilin-type N-terminal cleavage/methylation domain-containing protein [Photobacterium rosenbergii]|uniref:Prepilin-type N-terminal cleavage/methylation domain-containing protein n=1 Tax=Photobacterium rosenbergii TaxID=294936 RepID=A0ABU3ZLE1_9GAMM|nr:prepilin-type N-terminal cleavage/methylation domain-containing protein [Photobacterium rosenbergii]MDV5170947.1 prepilin-type N-terminal cleavage/methylation domain-containing protein [Photobacterium rosenbergii]